MLCYRVTAPICIAGALLNTVQRGYDIKCLNRYPERIKALSLEQVNSAVSEHLQPEKMTIIEAGDAPPPASRK